MAMAIAMAAILFSTIVCQPLPRVIWNVSESAPVGLGAQEVFLMNSHAASLDGRYFGALPLSSVIGQVIPFGSSRPSLEGNVCIPKCDAVRGRFGAVKGRLLCQIDPCHPPA